MLFSRRIKQFFGWDEVRQAPHVLVAQIQQSLRLQAVSLVSHILGTVSVFAFFHSHLGMPAMVLWASLAAISLWMQIRFRHAFRSDNHREEHIERWKRQWMLNAIASGAVWAIAGSAFLFPMQSMDEVVLVVVIVAVVFASWPVYSCLLPSLTVFTLLSLTPMFYGLASTYGVGQVVTSIALIVITSFVLYSGRRLNEIVVLSVVRNLQNERLVTRLRAEKTLSERARQAMALSTEHRTRFFAGANHDLRQPLQALGIYLGLLRTDAAPKQLPVIDQVQSCAQDISNLVERILVISRLESSSVPLHPQIVSVRSIFEELALEFRPLCEERELRFVVATDDFFIQTDPDLIKRLFRNLLSNAVRYSDKAQGQVLLQAAASGEERIVIEVKDEGIGIEPQDVPRVFDAFYRGSSTRLKNPVGYGLGLSIVKVISERLEIPIHIESKPGCGTTFRLVLLREHESAPVKAPPAPSARRANRIEGTVALIEDNRTVRDALQSVLEAHGAVVEAAEAPQSDFNQRIISMAQAGTLHGLICDFNLGEGYPNGLEAMWLVQSTSKTPVRCILLTAVDADVIEATYNSLRDAYPHVQMRMPPILQKPASPEELIEALLGSAD